MPQEKTGSAAPGVYWAILGALVWIATRNLDKVGVIECKLNSWRDHLGMPAGQAWRRELSLAVKDDCMCENGRCLCFDMAQRELVEALQSGSLEAFGIHSATDDTQFIQKEEFAFAQMSFSPVDGLMLLRKFRLLRVRRDQVLGLWPAKKPQEPADEEERHASVMSTAAAVRECEQWLLGELANPANATMRQPQFKARAVSSIFKGRLSGRGFKTAWAAATQRYPDFRRPGPGSRKIPPP